MSEQFPSAASSAAETDPACRDPAIRGAAKRHHSGLSAEPAPRVRQLDPACDLREPVLFMRLPVAALSPGRTDDFLFETRAGGQVRRLTVSSATSAVSGHATVTDLDALIPLLGELTARQNEGQPLARRLPVRPSSVLRVLGRPRGGRQLHLLADAFVRLSNTQLLIEDELGLRIFSPVECLERPPAGGSGPWHVTLASELLNEVAAGRVLKIDPAALRLTGLARRLYSLCRAWAGGRDGLWRVDLGLLARLCAWQGTWRRFRRRIGELVAAQALPSFVLTLETRVTRSILVVMRIAAPSVRRGSAPTEAEALDFGGDLAFLDAVTAANARTEVELDFGDAFDGLLPSSSAG